MASKKILGIIIPLVILSVILSSVLVTGDSVTVSRAGSSLAEQITNLVNFIEKAGDAIFRPLLGNINTDSSGQAISDSGAMLVTKVLMFFLVTLVIVSVLGAAGNPFGSGWINIVAGAIVSILGIRFLPIDFIQEITLPSQVFTAVAVTLIPLIIFFFLVEGAHNRTLTKVSWVVYAVIMAILWFYNWDTHSGLIFWLYPLAIIACITLLWFDGTIRAWWAKQRAENAVEEAEANKKIDITIKIADLKQKQAELISAGNIKAAALLSPRIKALEKQI